MTIRNPSEIARLEDELEYYRHIVKNVTFHKKSREQALSIVRGLEKQLGVPSENYNSGNF